MLVTTILTLMIIGGLLRPQRSAADLAVGRWVQIASYRNGRISHITPMREHDHTEDEFGECACNPQAGGYRLRDRGIGTLYVHRVIADDDDRRTR